MGTVARRRAPNRKDDRAIFSYSDKPVAPLRENFTLLEAALVCGISITTVKKVIRSGYLEAYQCGGELRVTWFDLFAFALSYGRVADRSRV